MGFLCKKLGKKNSTKEKHTELILGFIGTGRGVGVTHLCMLMANYMYSVCGRKTAVLEWNDHGDFERLGDVCTAMGRLADCYRIQGVDYYQRSSGRTLSQCVQKGYERILIDFGSWQEQKEAELLHCQQIYLLVSFSEWQEGAFGNCGNWKVCAESEGWRCLAAFGSEESRLRWNKQCRPKVERIPFSADAFTLTKPMLDWLKQILQ